MKLTIWQGFKLSAWLITSFLLGLMIVIYILDFKAKSLSPIFYINKIAIIIVIWFLMYFFKFIFKRLSKINKLDINEKN